MLFGKKTTALIKIEGMHCEKCVAKVESALKALGVKAKIDLKLRRAQINYPTKLDFDTIKSAIEALGFHVEQL